MRSKKKRLIFLVSIFVITILISSSIIILNRKDNIDYVLKTKSYSYLPIEAQEYIKEVYEETGEVVLTEKNKEENKTYLNPQYIEYLTLSDEEKETYGEIPVSMIIDYVTREEVENITVPNKFDLKDEYITPVRDQGDLGLCWAFASAGVAESYLLKNTDITIESPLLISERQMDYVTSSNGIKDYNSEYVSFVDRQLGDGGNFYISTIAMANGVSLVDYNNFKAYDDNDLEKMELADVINYKDSLYEVDFTTNLPRMNYRESTDNLTEEEKEIRDAYLKEIKQRIMNNGAAYVGTYMNSNCQITEPNSNNVLIDIYNCSKSGSHAMQIIGWDDDIEYTYCADTLVHKTDVTNCKNVVSGKGVWILKNSWGKDDQYPYLTYDSLDSSISFIEDMKSNAEKNWDNNYILGEESDNISEKTYYLTNSKIKGEELIKKIKFITETIDTTYTIKIYDKNGTYKTYTKETDLPGLITVDITEDIIIDKDSKIEISSDGTHIDKVSVFTSNIDAEPYINLDEYNNKSISEHKIRMYSETKNIPSDDEITYKLYKLYNSNEEEVSGEYFTFENNEVAENNVNTLLGFSKNMESGIYKLDAIYNSNIVSSINIEIKKMEGSGTEEDPYIITNSTQLDQIRDDLDAYYELANDIDLTEDTREGGKFANISELCNKAFGWEGINNFNGSIDGKGYAIKGLYQDNYKTCDDYKEWKNNSNGFINYAYGNVTIKNLTLEDFDITCQGGNCGTLISYYDAMNDDYNDKTEYNAVFDNIIIKNSKINGVYNVNNNANSSVNAGGLLGNVFSYYGNVFISNIFLGIEPLAIGNKDNADDFAYLTNFLSAKNVKVNNIQAQGMINGKYDSGTDADILFSTLFVSDSFELNNVISTVIGSKIGGHLFGTVWGTPANLKVSGVNLLKFSDKGVADRFDKETDASIINLNYYDKDTDLKKLTEKNNYSTWDNFDNNWIIKTVDGIPRIPVLKNVDFEYTSIPDIKIVQKINEHKNIYDYIYPNTESAKLITYKSNDEKIVKIDENGIIIPQSTGETTIHIESYYDGYIKDVPISITYEPHYNVYFDANGGNGNMDFVEVKAGNKYLLPENKFELENYLFVGWNTKADGSGTSYNDLDEIPAMNDKDSITLYAQWGGEVIYDATGGTVNPEKKLKLRNGLLMEHPIPYREGYGFEYWTLVEGAITTPINYFAQPKNYTHELKLIAKWEENAYTLVYDANGGNAVEDNKPDSSIILLSKNIATTSVKNNTDEIISSNFYVKNGYKFVGWNTKADGSGTSYTENQTINLNNVEKSTFTLYAQWEELEEYSITFYANDGTNTSVIQNVMEGENAPLDKNTFTRVGYKFIEWNTESDGSGTSYTDEEEISITSNLELYAQWEKEKYTLTFYVNGGTGTMNEQVFTYDTLQKITKNTFTKDKYTFAGWNTESDGSGTSYTDEEEIKLTDNLTLYAQWEKGTYTLTFDANGGTGTMNEQVFTYDTLQKITKNAFKKEGYTFTGWNTEKNGSGEMYTDEQQIKLTDNLTVYAQWKESYSYVINKYSYDDKKKIIDKIDINTTVNNFKKSIKLNTGYSIKVDYKTIDSKNLLYTGGKTKIYKDNALLIEYKNIIRGEVSGDGKINYLDYVNVYNHIQKVKHPESDKKALTDVYAIAADFSQDDKVNYLDYVQIYNKIKELKGGTN